MGLIKFLQDRKAERRARREEAAFELALFQDNLRYALLPRNERTRKEFTEELKKQIWDPEQLLDLSSLAKEDPEVFLKAQCAFAKKYKIKTFAQVGKQSVFFQLLVITRGLYGQDIGPHVSFRSAAKVVMEEVLLHK